MVAIPLGRLTSTREPTFFCVIAFAGEGRVPARQAAGDILQQIRFEMPPDLREASNHFKEECQMSDPLTETPLKLPAEETSKAIKEPPDPDSLSDNEDDSDG
jgi:hypothetical protein